MKITVKKGQNCKIITIPNSLIFNQASLWLGSRYLPGTSAKLDFRSCRAILTEFARVKKRHGSWTLVEVQSANGEAVTITL